MLYVLATPLGHLGDISARALEVLEGCAAVFCEDTRRTRKLLSHYQIHKPVWRLQENRPACLRQAGLYLNRGDHVVLATDAGTPCISDPGVRLVSHARAMGWPVTVVPGPSALTAALSGAGLPTDGFVFLGFLPRKNSKRLRLLGQAAALRKTVVLYESPYRLLSLIQDLRKGWGEEARVVLAHELTKIHEQWICGTFAEVTERLEKMEKILGEWVVLVSPGYGDKGPAHPIR